jgi:hypothetical protein
MATYAWDDNSYLGSSTFVLQGDGSAQWRTGVGYTLPQMSSANVPAGLVSVDIVFPTAMAASGAGLFLGAAPPPWITTPPVVPLPPVSWLPATPPPTNTNYFGVSSLTVGQTATLTAVHPGGKLYLMGQRGSGPEAGRGFISRINLRPLAPLPGPPTITKLIPASGPDTGGTLVDIIGTDLTGATAVDFGGTAGTGLTVDPSGGLATVTSPAHTAGPAPVTITTPAGTSAAKTFTYEAPPVVTVPVIYGAYPVSLCADAPDSLQVLSPIISPITDVVSAEVGGVNAGVGGVLDIGVGGAVFISPPSLSPGTYDLILTNSAGSSDPWPIEYIDCEGCPPDPTVVAVFPDQPCPGATIQLVGTNLTDATVTMCGETVAIVSNDGNIITVVVPPGCPDGPTTITVTTPDGETTAGLTVLPASGPTGGPDVIANLVALLAAELGVPVSSRRSPTATKDSDPSVVVRRTGGPSKGVASDNPTVTIEAWAPTTTESFQLLQSARLVVIEAAEQGRAGLRRYDELAGPADLPDPSTTNPRHTLTASVVTRLE